MVFKTRRSKRIVALEKAGFTLFERRELSAVPFTVPYMRSLMRARLKRWKEAQEKGMSRLQFEKMLKTEYVDKGWHKKTKTGRMVYDARRMLRDFEDKYKAKHPEYSSPWEKKPKNYKDFRAKLDATYAKYPAGRAYKRKEAPARRIRYLPEGGAVFED